MIEVQSITKSYGSTHALDGVTFRVESGKVTGFLGPNGAGKSTLMKIVVGLEQQDAGEIRIDGSPYGSVPAPLAVVGTALDASWLHPRRSACDHLRALALTHGIPGSRVHQVLDMVGLGEVARRKTGQFSLGMRQRLALAAAVLGEPSHLILDEPVNGLDPDGITWLRGFMRDYASSGKTVFLSSHLITEMSLVADHVVVIGQGKILADSPMQVLLGSSAPQVHVRSLDDDTLAARVNQVPGAQVTASRAGLIVTGVTAECVGQFALECRVALIELKTEHGSLEDVYATLTAGSRTYQSQALLTEGVSA